MTINEQAEDAFGQLAGWRQCFKCGYPVQPWSPGDLRAGEFTGTFMLLGHPICYLAEHVPGKPSAIEQIAINVLLELIING